MRMCPSSPAGGQATCRAQPGGQGACGAKPSHPRPHRGYWRSADKHLAPDMGQLIPKVQLNPKNAEAKEMCTVVCH